MPSPTGASTTFQPGYRGGTGTIAASVETPTGAVSASAPVTVAPGRLRIASIRYGIGANSTLLVSARAVDAGGNPVPRARVSIVVRRTLRKAFIGRKPTGTLHIARELGEGKWLPACATQAAEKPR